MEQIFTISGKAFSGKDSVANFLKKKLGGDTVLLHYADRLKDIAKNYLGWDGNKDFEGRNLLQFLGSDLVRIKLNKPLFWVKSVCDIIEIIQDDHDYFCIPDCRFQNEVYYPMAYFPNMVTTIHIIRLNFDNGLTSKQKKHMSETSLDNFEFDYIIRSESGLDNLEKEVDKFLIKYNNRER